MSEMQKKINSIQSMLDGLFEGGDVTEAARSSLQYTLNEAQEAAENTTRAPTLAVVALNDKIVDTVKEIRKKSDNYRDKATFCSEHNFHIEKQLNYTIEDELKKICHLIQSKFDLGYVG